MAHIYKRGNTWTARITKRIGGKLIQSSKGGFKTKAGPLSKKHLCLKASILPMTQRSFSFLTNGITHSKKNR
ncbi:Arm DNA-binding domain-containing protein [Lactobacillus delbrueckii]|uniref:Arm DNA-binding domain-containing protein n=1 Tax=Lactobacillus delbrueckii TaxID=1584 RepID=UPI0038731689